MLDLRHPTDRGARTRGAVATLRGIDGLILRDVEQKTRVPAVTADVGLRRGVGGDADVGLRLYTIGVEIGAKWRVIRGAWRVAIAPAIDYVRLRETQATVASINVFGHLPVIIGRRLSPDVGLNFGPAPMYGYYYPATGGSAQGLMIGGFGNVDVRLSQSWRLLPEMSLHRTAWGDVPISGWVGQFGVGVLWDL